MSDGRDLIDGAYTRRMLDMALVGTPNRDRLVDLITSDCSAFGLIGWAKSITDDPFHKWIYVMEDMKTECEECGSYNGLGAYQIIPACKGGASCPGNFVTLCKTCGSSKGGKTLDDWRAWKAARNV